MIAAGFAALFAEVRVGIRLRRNLMRLDNALKDRSGCYPNSIALIAGWRLNKVMTKYVNMAPPRYVADDSKSSTLLPLMIAAAAGVAIRNARLFEATRDAARERARLLEQRDQHLRQLRM